MKSTTNDIWGFIFIPHFSDLISFLSRVVTCLEACCPTNLSVFILKQLVVIIVHPKNYNKFT